ncbi:hypothetical protein [Ralstonia pickettii]|jgi:hypothetical protein|uniref:hypothetical protein n=1 Tax=Ralstonia pickettii TaxID=329 RepID=UPI000158BDB3|nr:hypothetical protein [Ralstonia pickettii]
MEKVEAIKECGVDLSETTARELGELVGAENISRFRGVLYSNAVPYKRVRELLTLNRCFWLLTYKGDGLGHEDILNDEGD